MITCILITLAGYVLGMILAPHSSQMPANVDRARDAEQRSYETLKYDR